MSDNELVKCVLIDLADEARRGDREYKRSRRHTFMGWMFQSRTSFSHFGFLRDLPEERPDLPIGWKLNEFPFTLAQFFCQAFQTDIFIHGHDRRPHRMRVEFANQLLKFWASDAVTVVGPVRDTRNLPQFFGPLDKSPERRDAQSRLLSDRLEGFSLQHSSHRIEIAMKMRLLLCRL